MPSKVDIENVFKLQIPCEVKSIIKQVSAYQHIVSVILPNKQEWQVLLEIGYKLTNLGFDISNIIGMNVYGKYLNNSPSFKEYIKDGKPSGNFSIIMTPVKSSYNIRDFDEFLNMVVKFDPHQSKSVYLLNGIISKFLIPRNYDGKVPICIRSINRDRSYPDQLFIHTDFITQKEDPKNICFNLINMYTGKPIYENNSKETNTTVKGQTEFDTKKTFKSNKIISGNSYASALMKCESDEDKGGSAAQLSDEDSNIAAQIENIQKFAINEKDAEVKIQKFLKDNVVEHQEVKDKEDEHQEVEHQEVEHQEVEVEDEDEKKTNVSNESHPESSEYEDEDETNKDEINKIQINIPAPPAFNPRDDISGITEWVKSVNEWYVQVFGKSCQ